jgi:zinc D-Ala-D-Ala carboxypeptidase
MTFAGRCAVGMLLAVSAAHAACGAEDPCGAGPRAAAAANAASLSALSWAPFRRPELGWAVYAPLVGEEIGISCAPSSPAFAAGLAVWQKQHQEAASGQFDPATFLTMEQAWEQRRPFIIASRHACPSPPDETTLEEATPAESYGGKQILLKPEALAAYRRLLASAREALPVLSTARRLLTIFSGYRSPDSDAARCLRDNNCQGVVRASCSAHRTGTAMDLYLGAAPGFALDSSDDANRLYLSRTPAYLWLVHNASRFGFVNYPFEPWHWEWTGNSAIDANKHTKPGER